MNFKYQLSVEWKFGRVEFLSNSGIYRMTTSQFKILPKNLVKILPEVIKQIIKNVNKKILEKIINTIIKKIIQNIIIEHLSSLSSPSRYDSGLHSETPWALLLSSEPCVYRSPL